MNHAKMAICYTAGWNVSFGVKLILQGLMMKNGT